MPIARGTDLERIMNRMSINSVLVSLVAAMTLVLLFADQVTAQTTTTTPSASVGGDSLTSRSPGNWITQAIANEQNGNTKHLNRHHLRGNAEFLPEHPRTGVRAVRDVSAEPLRWPELDVHSHCQRLNRLYQRHPGYCVRSDPPRPLGSKDPHKIWIRFQGAGRTGLLPKD